MGNYHYYMLCHLDQIIFFFDNGFLSVLRYLLTDLCHLQPVIDICNLIFFSTDIQMNGKFYFQLLSSIKNVKISAIDKQYVEKTFKVIKNDA